MLTHAWDSKCIGSFLSQGVVRVSKPWTYTYLPYFSVSWPNVCLPVDHCLRCSSLRIDLSARPNTVGSDLLSITPTRKAIKRVRQHASVGAYHRRWLANKPVVRFHVEGLATWFLYVRLCL